MGDLLAPTLGRAGPQSMSKYGLMCADVALKWRNMLHSSADGLSLYLYYIYIWVCVWEEKKEKFTRIMKHVFQFGSVWQRTCHDPNVSLSPLLVRSQLGRQNHITFSPVRRTLRALWLWQQPRCAQEHEANTNEIQRQGVRCPEQQTHAITIYNWGSCPECWGRKNQAQTNKRHA